MIILSHCMKQVYEKLQMGEAAAWARVTSMTILAKVSVGEELATVLRELLELSVGVLHCIAEAAAHDGPAAFDSEPK